MLQYTSMEAPPKKPILQLHGVSKRFGAVQALQDVDFEVYHGEVVGLVGDNGAGKSTLVKVMSGVHPPDSGKVFFDGREVTINSPRDSTNLGIETVYQDLALCDNLNVVANLYVGPEFNRQYVRGPAAVCGSYPGRYVGLQNCVVRRTDGGLRCGTDAPGKELNSQTQRTQFRGSGDQP